MRRRAVPLRPLSLYLLAICRPSGCTVASGVVGVVDVCNRSQMRTSNTHTTVLLLFWNLSGTTRVSRYQKGKTRKSKTNLDLLEQEMVSGSGIYWAIMQVCTSSQTTTPTSHHSVFTGRMPFLPPNQQRQSTEGEQSTNSITVTEQQ